jgi:hypothetical protein
MSDYRSQVDTERCYFCPKRNGIEVHHIVPQRFQGADNRENLVAVCDKCHKKLERLYDQSFYSTLGIEDATEKRAKHFPCIRCDKRAKKKIWDSYGERWMCDEHGDRLLRNRDDAKVTKEVGEE